MTTPIDPYAFLSGASSATDTKSNQQLGQNEFLKLMLAQMKNQDPFKPNDPTQFLSQLAQFSTVTGIQNMQGSVEGLASSLRSTQVLNGTSLVGREILAPATVDTIEAGGTVKGAVDVPKGAASVQISVKDGSGALVRRFSMTPAEGLQEFTWDGLDNSGNVVPAGQYTFDATANLGGLSTALDPLLSSRVASVTIDPKNGSLTLNTSTGSTSISDVRRVL
jgi:flagellar basal-body rod modification protein FlgD